MVRIARELSNRPTRPVRRMCRVMEQVTARDPVKVLDQEHRAIILRVCPCRLLRREVRISRINQMRQPGAEDGCSRRN